MRCDRCKHWGEQDGEEDSDATRAGMRRCIAIKERWEIEGAVKTEHPAHVADYGTPEYEAAAEEFMSTRTKALIDARAYAQDGSDYIAHICTRPDFFCALFDERKTG